ncbi:MAG: hypothetical protein GY749_34120 [Desulfobacteraceae bacterium]|nr:hypothetical protein [Desulfobacteraceae bacterium]
MVVSQAQQRGISVSLTGPEVFEVEPKNVVTTTFDIRNTANIKHELTAQLILPKGWKNLTGKFPFTLNPGANKIELVSFFVPRQTLAGKYEITYMVRSETNAAVRDFKTIYVTVLPVSKIQARVLESPEYVIAGQEYQAVFIITNESNAESIINISADSGYNLPYKIDAEKIRLGPGASETVNVTVKTNEKTVKKLKHLLRLIAQSREEKAEASAYVEIIPKVTVEEDRFHRIPSRITLRQIIVKSKKDSSGFQGEFSGEGPLDDQGKKHISFLFKGPDILDRTGYGDRDEYRVKYRTSDYDLFLGDNSYSLSPLTENYLYGRGIRGNLYLDNFSIGAYHMKTHRLDPDEEQSALNIGYLFDEGYWAGVNFLKKSEDEGSKTISMQGRFKLAEKTNLEFEMARGAEKDGEYNSAYWVNLNGANKLISYYFKYIYAEPGHPGYYNDREMLSGNFTFPINQELSFSTSFRQEKTNLDSDSSLDSTPIERYGQFGIDYRFSTGSYISLYSQVRTYEDRFPDPDSDYIEKTLRIGMGRKYDTLFLYASAEKGIKEDRLKNQEFDLDRYTGSVYFRPDKRQTYSAYLRYSDDEFYEEESTQTITAGLRGSFRFSGRTRLSIDLQTYNYPDSEKGDRDTVEISADHTLPNDHAISGKVRHSSYRNSDEENETLFFAEYMIPVGVPVGINKNVGMVKGYLFDEETGKPISETILRLDGITAVTDKSGIFSFPSVKPGSRYLDVDQAGIGLEKITAHKTPFNINIEGGREAFINIAVTRSAKFSGQVVSYQFSDKKYKDFMLADDDLVEKGPLANVLVEVKKDTEIKRRITDSKGNFKFEELRPGKWKVKIYPENLPEYHYLEKDVFEFELSPGAEEDIFVRALPKKRHIQFVAQGGTLTEKPLVATSPVLTRKKASVKQAESGRKSKLVLQKITVVSSKIQKEKVALGKLVTKPGIQKRKIVLSKLKTSQEDTHKNILLLGKLTTRPRKVKKNILILGHMKVRSLVIRNSRPVTGLPYSVQVATCSEKENAQKVVNKLKQTGYAPYYFKDVDSANQEWYKVRIGDYPSMEEAAHAAITFQKKEGKPVIIHSDGIKIFYL